MSIFWGLISAVILFYFRECLKLAHEQRAVAVRVGSYLHYWTKKNLENDSVFRLTAIGYQWAERLSKSKNTKDIINIDKEFNENLDKLLESGTVTPDELHNLEQSFSEISSNSEHREEMVFYLKEYRKDIINGSIFPSDNESSKLGIILSKQIISFKMEQIGFIEELHHWLLFVDKENIPYKLKDITFKLIIKWIKLNRDKRIIVKSVEKYLEKNIFSRAFNNFIVGL